MCDRYVANIKPQPCTPGLLPEPLPGLISSSILGVPLYNAPQNPILISKATMADDAEDVKCSEAAQVCL